MHKTKKLIRVSDLMFLVTGLFVFLFSRCDSFRPGSIVHSIERVGRIITRTKASQSNDEGFLLRKNVELYSSISVNNSLHNTIPSVRELTKPEVLSPAGGWPQLIAACSNGADAVYFGLQEGFNARVRASNFGIDDVERVMIYLHDRGVKGYVVVNILVFDEEMMKLEPLIRRLVSAGVDALIMQDIGAVELVRKIAPNLPVHGSTQMSITDSHGADFATHTLGIDRVVVGRELSLKEITSIALKSEAEVEAFVHGALCVSYSGQCFSSEAWGGRSANRGQCAQACRMPYGLVVNGTLKDLQDVQYLLSPQDLMAVDYVPQLILAGVKSFKIEGRLKGAEYVAVTTRAYRKAVDEAWSLLQGDDASNGVETFQGPDLQTRRDLKQVFSRGQDEQYDGLSAGFLLGVKHQNLVRGRNPRHRGLLVGRVTGVSSKGISVQLSGPVKRGDGVVFDSGRPEQKEEGGSVYEVFHGAAMKSEEKGEEVSSGRVTLTFGRSAVDTSRVQVGDYVWRNKDADLETRVKKYLEESKDKKYFEVDIQVSGCIGSPLVVHIECLLSDGRKIAASAETKSVISPATKRPISEEDIAAAIGSFGDMPFAPKSSAKNSAPAINFEKLNLQMNAFIPIAEVKSARRDAAQNLLEQLRQHDRTSGMASPSDSDSDSTLQNLRASSATKAVASLQGISGTMSETAQLSILCRTPEQVAAACQINWLNEVVLDFLEVHGLRESVAAVRAAGKTVVVATPRIIKPDEERLFSFYLRLQPDALLVRSAGFLQQLVEMGGPGALYAKGVGQSIRIPPLHGDFSLNAANVLSAGLLLQVGLSRLAPTHDLDAEQICSMATLLNDFGATSAGTTGGGLAASSLEVVLYQHLPIFHTDHCVFCRFLSSGNSYLDCGKPCEQNSVHLRALSDGQDHLVLADQGCRNTVFNAKAQNGAAYAAQFLSSGIRRFRIELVDEPAEYVRPLLERYRAVMETASPHGSGSARRAVGEVGLTEAVDELSAFLRTVPNKFGSPQGANEGSLRPTVEIKKAHMKVTAAEKAVSDKEEGRKDNNRKHFKEKIVPRRRS